MTDSSPTSSSFRSVAIRPPSAATEAAFVLQAAAVILIVTWLYLANTTPNAARSRGANDPSLDIAAAADVSSQKLFRDLNPHDQRMFRAMHEGLLEAENNRSANGTWPAPAALAQQGIAPFAPNRIAQDQYVWTLQRDSNVVNYVGRPADARLPAFLILILEPTPGAPADPAPVDEQHHQLANGDKLHVSLWLHPDGGKVPDELVPLPDARGWTKLVTGTNPTPNP